MKQVMWVMSPESRKRIPREGVWYSKIDDRIFIVFHQVLNLYEEGAFMVATGEEDFPWRFWTSPRVAGPGFWGNAVYLGAL